MTLEVELSPELEEALAEESRKRGLTPVDFTLEVLKARLDVSSKKAEAIALLQSWIDDETDTDEQRETGEYLLEVLDQDRTSHRKLFPPELKGISW